MMDSIYLWQWNANGVLIINNQGNESAIPIFDQTIRVRYEGIQYGNVQLQRYASNSYPSNPETPKLLLRRPIRPQYSVPLLKSNLQKAIRRQKVNAVLASAAALLYQNPTELLRRLPIIAAEDVCLIPDTDKIIWLMAAVSKGYSLTPEDLALVMGYVHILALYPKVCDYASPPVPESFGELWKTVENPSKESSIRLSLLVRMSYGGMGGDQKLLQRAATSCARHAHAIDSTLLIQDPARTALHQWFLDRDMQHDEQLPESVDFHCTGILKGMLAIVPASEEHLRQTMWIHRSSFNVRKPANLPHPPDWWGPAEAWLRKKCQMYWKPCTESSSSAPAPPPPSKKRKTQLVPLRHRVRIQNHPFSDAQTDRHMGH